MYEKPVIVSSEKQAWNKAIGMITSGDFAQDETGLEEALKMAQFKDGTPHKRFGRPVKETAEHNRKEFIAAWKQAIKTLEVIPPASSFLNNEVDKLKGAINDGTKTFRVTAGYTEDNL